MTTEAQLAADELTETLKTLRDLARHLTSASMEYEGTFAKVQVGRARDRILECINVTKDARDTLEEDSR